VKNESGQGYYYGHLSTVHKLVNTMKPGDTPEKLQSLVAVSPLQTRKFSANSYSLR